MSARDLPAGAALNVAIAEALWDIGADGWPKDEKAWPWWLIDEDGVRCPRLPDFSGDIDAAFTALAKLRADGKILMASVNVGESGWWCALYPPLGYGSNAVESEYCDTAPEAICRAALAAVERAS